MKTLLGIVIGAALSSLIWWTLMPPRQPMRPIAPLPSQRPSQKPLVLRPIPMKRLAAEGTFFLLERATLTNNAGVIGFRPGTKVTFLSRHNELAKVTDGQFTFDVRLSQLTNDLDLAESLAAADYKTQLDIAQSLQAQIKAHEQEAKDEAEQSAKKQAEIAARRPYPGATPLRDNPLNRGAYDATTSHIHVDRNGNTYWIDVFGRPHY